MGIADQPTIVQRQAEAALAAVREQADEIRRVEETVLGDRQRGQRVYEIVKLGDDYLAKVEGGTVPMWTFVVNGKPTSWRYENQEDAILHLIAARYDSNPNSNYAAAHYAGRVLGRPDRP